MDQYVSLYKEISMWPESDEDQFCGPLPKPKRKIIDQS